MNENNKNDLKAELRRKLKAAIYVVALADSMVAKARIAGKKCPRRATCVMTKEDMKIMARRRFRSAVYAILAAQGLQKAKLTQYKDPIFEWEDTTVPQAPTRLIPELSLEVDDLFASEEEYTTKVKCLKGDEKRRQMLKEELQDILLAVNGTQELNRALDLNIHPRQRFSGLAHALDILPAVDEILKDQELHRIAILRMAMRRMFRGAVLAVMMSNYITSHLQAKMNAEHASMEWSTLLKCHQRNLLEKHVRDRLKLLGSHPPPCHPQTLRDAARVHHGMEPTGSGIVKFNAAVDTILLSSK